MYSFIDWQQMQDYRETSRALKRTEKIGLKLESGKCEESKVFVT